MKGIYLASCKARHEKYDLIYNDIDPKYKPDIVGDMLQVDLTPYDFIIASPPCNWWSKANPYYKTSKYALETKHLLPDTIIKLSESGKPFIIENVKNIKRMAENGIFDLINKYGLFYQFVGRHIYIYNGFLIDLNCEQIQDFVYGGKRVNKDGYNQGGTNVYNVIEIWLKQIDSII
jgi:site-specific DNA-cytosine methylase